MKKFFIIIAVLVILSPAAAVHAFSFVDVINFGSRLFHPEPQPTTAEVKDDLAAQPVALYTYDVDVKYSAWQNAFNSRNIATLIANNNNLYFTEAEMNYLIARVLASSSAPAARDVTVTFSDNLIKISGISMLKTLPGKFYLEAKPIIWKKQLTLSVTKVRYNNFYFPAFIAQSILANQLRAAINFLYSDPDYQTITMTVGSGFAQLNYAQ
jgi:hypothetical protein